MFDEEAAAQGCFVIIRPGKRWAIRILERILYPVIRVWERVRPGQGEPSEIVQRILIVEYSLLGDIVMLLPFLQNLRAHYPNSHITLLVHPSVQTLLKYQDLADELIFVRMPSVEHLSRIRKWNPFSSLGIELGRRLLFLRRQKFDLAFSVRGDLRDNFLLWLTGAKRRVGYGFGGGSFLLTDPVTPDLDHPHISDRWLRFLKCLGKPIFAQRPHLKLSPTEEEIADRYLAEYGIKNGDLVIGIHSKARHPTRRWSEEKFRTIGERLIGQFPAKVLWFRDPKDGPQKGENTNGMIPVCLPLREFMAVLSRCKFLICNDGGQMHIATALGVPVIAVFGSTEPTWYSPIGEQNRVVIRSGFWCRPCAERCVFDKPYCIQMISVEPVWKAATELIRSLATGEAPIVIHS